MSPYLCRRVQVLDFLPLSTFAAHEQTMLALL